MNLKTIYRPYCAEIRSIFKIGPTTLKRVSLCLYLFYFFRFLIHLHAFVTSFQSKYIKVWLVDYLAAFGHQSRAHYNLVLCFIFCMINLFGCVGTYFTYFTPRDLLAWHLMYDVVVRNTQDYLNCFRSADEIHLKRQSKTKKIINDLSWIPAPRPLLWILASLWARLVNWYRMKHIELDLLMKNRLQFLPNLSQKPRILILLALDGIELFYSVFPIIFCGASAAFLLSYLSEFLELQFPFWYSPIIVLDLILFEWATLIFVRLSCVSCFNVILACLLYSLYAKQLYSSVYRILDRKSFKTQFTNEEDLSGLSQFLVEHTRLSYYLLRTNQELWSRFLFAFAPIQLLTMIFLLLNLMDPGITAEQKAKNFTIFWLYCWALFTALFPLAYISYSMHKHVNRLVPIQFRLAGFRLRAKLKFLTFYERLTSLTGGNNAKPYGLSIGPINTVTFPVIGQLCLQFSIYLMFFINFRRSSAAF